MSALQILPTPPPFASPLPRQRIDDIEARFRDECEIRKHIGESDEMMVINCVSCPLGAASVATRNRFFGAQSDAHEGVVLHLRHRDNGIGIVKTGTQCIPVKH